MSKRNLIGLCALTLACSAGPGTRLTDGAPAGRADSASAVADAEPAGPADAALAGVADSRPPKRVDGAPDRVAPGIPDAAVPVPDADLPDAPLPGPDSAGSSDGRTDARGGDAKGKRDVGEVVDAIVAPDTAADNGSANPPSGESFNLILGAPTATSIRVKVLATSQSGDARIVYGKASEASETPPITLTAGVPVEFSLGNLHPDSAYQYRVVLNSAQGTITSRSCAFHTARPAGSTFSFAVQADPHLDANSLYDVYRLSLANVLAEAPDFFIDLGDTFMCEKNSQPFVDTVQSPDEATVMARYLFEAGNFGLVSHSVPLFLVNGNHEGELGWENDGRPENLAVWSVRARLKYFVAPFPDVSYSGDDVQEPLVGKRGAWYAWHWGDALFVVLDPFWNSKTKTDTDGWALTLGEHQYRWLASTLAGSSAKFKFVFVHNLVGGLDGQMRGGIEAAPYYEWGGRNADNSMGFAARRPGWGKPIHQVLVDNKVTAVFHGHDHLYAKQVLDGIVYQEVPQPSARNNNSGAMMASQYHYASGTVLSSSGHLRLTVSGAQVTSQYVRTWLPSDENAQQRNGHIDDTWTVVAP